MGQRSAVELLPETVRDELNRKLVQSGFSGYRGLSEWLKDQGFEISKTAVHNYGQDFESRLSALKMATEQAKAVAETVEDEEGAMNEALIRLMQQKAFDALMQMEEEGADISFKDLGVLISRVSRASVNQKKFAREIRQAFAEEAASAAEESLKSQGMTRDTIESIKNEILGIA